MVSINLSDIAILHIIGSDYHCIISLIRKNESIKLLQNLTEKSETWKIGKLWIKEISKFFESIYKNEKKIIIKFGDIKIQKPKFHQHKDPISFEYLEYFIGYKDAKKVIPLCIYLPKVSAYGKDLDETKYISFLIKDD